MCLILDANRFGDALSEPTKPAYVPLLRWLTDPDGDGILVFGGTKYRREIGDHGKVGEFFVKRWRAGRAHEIDDESVNAEEARLQDAHACASDDEHVIALARLSGARVVCTHDHALIEDVHDKTLLDSPRGRVYAEHFDADHGDLLHHDRGCRKPPLKKGGSKPKKIASKKDKQRR